jgi:hypothetical protein
MEITLMCASQILQFDIRDLHDSLSGPEIDCCGYDGMLRFPPFLAIPICVVRASGPKLFRILLSISSPSYDRDGTNPPAFELLALTCHNRR